MTTRTVADIISGREPGVFGRVGKLETNDVLIHGWFHSVIVTLQNPIGLPVCGCGVKPPHTVAWIAGMPCKLGEPEETYRQVREYLADGIEVEFVGDIVVGAVIDPAKTGPLISGYFYWFGAPRNMTVPDRSLLPISEHCSECPIAPDHGAR